MKSAILFLLLFACSSAKAQWYIEPVAGWQVDINNRIHFKQLSTAVNFCNKISGRYEIIFQLQKSWPLAYQGADTAFTTNTTLPLHTTAEKTISPASFSLGMGQRFKVVGDGSNFLLATLYTGLLTQQVKVIYNYDKNNYTILNPDQTQTRTGLYIGCGTAYIRQFNKGRLLLQLGYSFLLQSKIYYPGSFNFLTPLSIEAGYSIPLTKGKHEKK
jgi:hypothetical protein